MKLDTTQNGWESVFKDYQILALNAVYDIEQGATSKAVWDYINERREHHVSRASVINFLQWAEGEGFIGGVQRSGKGGYHGVFAPKHTKPELSGLVIGRFLDFIEKNLSGEIQ